MSDESKATGGKTKSGEAPETARRLPANVSVLKIPEKKVEKSSAPAAAAKGKKTSEKRAENKKGAKSAPRKPENRPEKNKAGNEGTLGVKATGTEKPEMKEMKKEKTMAQKNSSSNANTNVPFDAFAKEAAEIGREYSEACVKSGSILMKGMEDMVGIVMSLAQSSAEKQAQFIKEAMSSKTINEFAEVQNKIAQSNFDDFMAGATKLTEIGTKLLTETAEPVNAQIGKAIKRASEAVAA